MKTQNVSIAVDVYCKWSGEPPVYRAYIGHELFAERTWIWNNIYLQEEFHISAPAGVYDITYQLLPGSTAGIKTRNIRVTRGPAVITPDARLEVRYENP